MAKKHPPTHGATQPPRIDDLKLINGIGPGVEKRLNSVGIYTFAQLATLSPADVAAAVIDLTGLSAERIIKQNWIGQARMLSEESTQTEARVDVELTMETRAAELQKTRKPSPELISTKAREECETLPKSEQIVAFTDFIETSQNGITTSKEKSTFSGTLLLRNMEIIGAEPDRSCRILRHNQPFDIRLTLDLTELIVPEDSPLQYKVSIYGKNRGSPSGQFVREARGTFLPTDIVTIVVEDTSLSQGTYQLVATVILALSSMKLTPKPGFMALIDGGLVQVY